MPSCPANSDSALPVISTIGRFAGAAVLLILALAAVSQMWQYGGRVPGLDFYQFWVVGTELRRGGAVDIYSDSQREALGKAWLDKAKDKTSRLYRAASKRPVLETFSTPWLYTVFAALSTGDYERDYTQHRLLCLAISVTSIVGLCRLCGYSWTASLLAVVLLTDWFAPMRSDIVVGNVNQLQVGGLALYIWMQSRADWRGRHFTGGAILGLLLAFKPNLAFAVALLFLSWAINRRWRKLFEEAIGLVCAVAVAVTVSSVIFGTMTCWLEWAESLRLLMNAKALPVSSGNVSLAALIEETTGGQFSKTLLLVFLAAVSGSLVLARRRANEEESSRDPDEDMLAITLGVAMMLISSSLAWVHYFVLLVPTAIYCFRPRQVRDTDRGRWREQTVAAVAVVLIALHPLKLVMTFHNMYLPAAFCSLGTVMLSILAIREIVSVRNHADSPHSVGNQRDDETLVPA